MPPMRRAIHDLEAVKLALELDSEVFDSFSVLTNLHPVPERLLQAGRIHRFDHGEDSGVGARGAAIGRESRTPGGRQWSARTPR